MTSRIEEREWSNNFSEHPLPSLYLINIETNKQVKETIPPKEYGDYKPKFLKSLDKLIWLRGTSLTDHHGDLWRARADGTGAEKWMDDVDVIEFYQGN